MNKLMRTLLYIIALPMISGAAEPVAAGSFFQTPVRIKLAKGGDIFASRGVLYVPMVRSKPGKTLMAVEFYRFPCRNPDSKAPPIFMLQGGPGFRGLERGLETPGYYEGSFARLGGLSDIVVVGQRGIGSSLPDTWIDFSLDGAEVADESAWKNGIREQLRKETRTWEQHGINPEAFTVLEAADDVRDVAAALGYQHIIALGSSFGSHWALAIMHRHPNLIARAILSGTEGPDQTWDDPTNLWKVYQKISDDVADAPEFHGRIPPEGLIKAFEWLVRSAEKQPLSYTSGGQTVGITAQQLRAWSTGYTGSVGAWPADMVRLLEGDFSVALRKAGTTTDKKAESGKKTEPSRDRDPQTLSALVLDAASGISRARRERVLASPALRYTSSPFRLDETIEGVWKADVGDEFRTGFRSEVPTLLVQGTFDTQTPFENATELLTALPNAKLVTVERGGHGGMFEAMAADPAFARQVVEFIATGKLDGFPETIKLPEPRWVPPANKN